MSDNEKTGYPPFEPTHNSNAKFNLDYSNDLGENLADVTVATLPAATRKKIYDIATKANAIAGPVYTLGGTVALFVGGSAGVTIGVGVGVLGVTQIILNSFVNRLAKRNTTV